MQDVNMTNILPNIPDEWRGSRVETAKILNISLRTLDRKAKIKKRDGGIEWLPGKRGKIFTGKEIKRFWRECR